MDDRHVIACNLTEGISEASEGSKAYVILLNPGNGSDRIEILLRSRGGRWIRKWEAIWRLGNFRVKTIPPEHPLYDDDRLWDYDPARFCAELEAAREREAMSRVR